MNNISVYLVGAGPGNSGLFTIRGREVLEAADVVIYDRLTGAGVMAMIPERAITIDAGKSAGAHKLQQNEIEKIMIDYAKKGLKVVRLKGGDPFLFGRGGEEAEALINAGINFEVVPGVSSALAVPECAGIPVTHRNFCSGINIFTAHDKNNLLPDFNNTASIFLMGVSHAKELQEKLLYSLSPETPCAIIENGTIYSQRVFRTKLSLLYNSVLENNIKPPAVIIAGKIAGINLSCRNNLKLHGKRIIITRPAGRGEKLAKMFRDYGAEVILMPTIKTSVIHDALNGQNISGYDWAGFTSVTGVEAFFEVLCESGRDVRELEGAKIAAIGSATRDALKSHGLKVEYMPEIYDGESLAKGLVKFGGSVLMFRALNGTPYISEILSKNDINFNEICIYSIDYVELKHVPENADIIIFTSASTVRGFAENIKTMRSSKAVCIGRQTAREAKKAGFENIIISEQASIEKLFESVISCA